MEAPAEAAVAAAEAPQPPAGMDADRAEEIFREEAREIVERLVAELVPQLVADAVAQEIEAIKAEMARDGDDVVD